mmetsp:Transcript_106976/g.180644  ORF Transcript_106976/g.180644 Transcript_106976/m.180644 type:complete len:80 (-) Transcript_106976:173-412(-)
MRPALPLLTLNTLMAPPRGPPSDVSFGNEYMGQYEVPLSHLPANPDPLVYPLSIRQETVYMPPTGWVRQCVELPGMPWG